MMNVSLISQALKSWHVGSILI